MKIRLHKAIAEAGLASRRGAEKMILEGLVSVNGEIINTMGFMVDVKKDLITVEGKPLQLSVRKRTYMMNKPEGVICTRSDPEGRKTIFDLLEEDVSHGLHTVGRLDFNAEGLIIITNDGELTHTLTHPSSHVQKTYLVKVKGQVSSRAMKKLRLGVEIDGRKTLPAKVTLERGHAAERNTWLRMVLREGRKNQIKKMGEAVGNPVLKIKRISIGHISLPERLRPGKYRKLNKTEIQSLVRAADKGTRSKIRNPRS